jgi:hypothetical protein
MFLRDEMDLQVGTPPEPQRQMKGIAARPTHQMPSAYLAGRFI